jgi:steroid delta-isomerase-like uncharacterized protein
MSEENQAAVRRFYELFNRGEFDALDEIMAPGYVNNDPQSPAPADGGREAVKAELGGFRAAFPDLRFTIDEQLADGDAVVTRWTATGTQDGDMPDLPATGRSVTVTGISIDHFGADGKMTDGYTNWDTMGMMQQLGAVPDQARTP